jgi:hypothetical protein
VYTTGSVIASCDITAEFSLIPPKMGKLTVNLLSAEAVKAGAQWQVDGGAWQNSAVSSVLAVGKHTVRFKDITAWITPKVQEVEIREGDTSISATYVLKTGTLTVVTLPAELKTGQWQVDGGAWQNSAASTVLALGRHKVAFKDASGWITPQVQDVDVKEGVNSVSGTYQPVISAVTSFSWIAKDTDRVSEGTSGRADGRKDGHFKAQLSIPAQAEISSIAIYSANDAGTPAGGQIWHTSNTSYWVLGVDKNGSQLNGAHIASLGTHSGTVDFDLFGSDSGWFNVGQTFLIEVTFGNGSKISKTTKVTAPAVQASINNGERCNSHTECKSNYCMPGPSLTPIAKNPEGGGKWYCTAAAMNCAKPGTDGARYGDKINDNGSLLTCKNPMMQGYWGQFMLIQ